MHKLIKAIMFATVAHEGQYRQGVLKQGYVIHCIRVVDRVMTAATTAGGIALPIDMLIAAVLHDVVEDTHVTLLDVEREFGHEVSRLVKWLTDDPEWTREERKARQAEKMTTAPPSVLMIKVADQTDNLSDMLESGLGPARMRRYLEGSAMVVSAASRTFEAREDMKDYGGVMRRLVSEYDATAARVRRSLDDTVESKE